MEVLFQKDSKKLKRKTAMSSKTDKKEVILKIKLNESSNNDKGSF